MQGTEKEHKHTEAVRPVSIVVRPVSIVGNFNNGDSAVHYKRTMHTYQAATQINIFTHSPSSSLSHFLAPTQAQAAWELRGFRV